MQTTSRKSWKCPECGGKRPMHTMAGTVCYRCKSSMIRAESSDDTFCPHGIPAEFCGNCHESESEGA